MPRTFNSLRIGLLGGSFDPPHLGHMHISKWALRAFDLDQLWWMLTPGNPFKTHKPAPMKYRLRVCRDLIDHPRIIATDIEAQFGTVYTADSLALLRRRYPRLRFVWLMGTDNMTDFHTWENWKDIMRMMPIGVLGRPRSALAAGLSPMARCYAQMRLPMTCARRLSMRSAPAWCLLTGRMNDLSSTIYRETGKWP